jgi:hypothetical protein
VAGQDRAGQAGDDAPASQDAAHDIGPEDYLDYDPEPYGRKLIAAWAGYRFIKPTRAGPRSLSLR